MSLQATVLLLVLLRRRLKWVCRGKSWKDIEIVAHNVGLRPARKNGTRLELTKHTIADGTKTLIPTAGRNQPRREGAVLHAYGIGPAGYQVSLPVSFSSPKCHLLSLSSSGVGWYRQRGCRYRRELSLFFETQQQAMMRRMRHNDAVYNRCLS